MLIIIQKNYWRRGGKIWERGLKKKKKAEWFPLKIYAADPPFFDTFVYFLETNWVIIFGEFLIYFSDYKLCTMGMYMYIHGSADFIYLNEPI